MDGSHADAERLRIVEPAGDVVDGAERQVQVESGADGIGDGLGDHFADAARHDPPGACGPRLCGRVMVVPERTWAGEEFAVARCDYEIQFTDQLGRGPRRVIVSPSFFNRKTTSDLLVGPSSASPTGGRLKEDADDGSDITRIYRHQLAACTYEVLRGPGKLLRWSVPSSRGHDDLLISTALTARLDAIDWRDRTARGDAGM
jgi:hypothetical protein